MVNINTVHTGTLQTARQLISISTPYSIVPLLKFERSALQRHFCWSNLLTELSRRQRANCHFEKARRVGSKYHKRIPCLDWKERERGESERERESDKTLKCISQEKEPSALLHFRWRSGELKGGPNANEMQFHATLSLPCSLSWLSFWMSKRRP